MADGLSESVSRRSVLKAAAWATPAVLLSVGTPALAASGEPIHSPISSDLYGLWNNTTAEGESVDGNIVGNTQYKVMGDWSATYDPLVTATLVVLVSGVEVARDVQVLRRYQSGEVVEFSTVEATRSGQLVIRPGGTYDVTFQLILLDDSGRQVPVRADASGPDGFQIITKPVTVIR